MSIFENHQDENIHQSLESLILPPPPSSIFGDVPLDDKLSENYANFHLGKNTNDYNKTNEKIIYRKKPVASFLNHSENVRYCKLVDEMKSGKIPITDPNFEKLKESYKDDIKTSLLLSFHFLYEEYCLVCDKLSSNSNDNNQSTKTFQDNSQTGDNFLELKPILYQTKLGQISQDHSIQTDFKEPVKDTNSNYCESDKSSMIYPNSIFQQLKNVFASNLTCLKASENLTQAQLNPMNVFDRIDSENIEVFEIHGRKKLQTVHKIILQKTEKGSGKKMNITIPIALELLLPKIQSKIERILSQCTFLCDPLEVMAELRCCNYDCQKCILYFQMTKYLRNLYSDSQSNDVTKNNNKEITPKSSIENVSDKDIYKTISYTNVTKNSETDLKVVTLECSNLQKLLTSTLMQTEHFNTVDLFALILKRMKSARQIQHRLTEDIHYLTLHLNKVFDSLKHHMVAVINQCSEKLVSNEQKLKLIALSRQVDELKLKLKQEEKRRRQVYNRMQEQMGNIRVYCRCRKLSDEENVLEYSGEDTLVLTTASNEKFEFDKLFQPGVSQEDLFEEFRPLVMSFIDGYNVCFITYGGEASGKTYTLIGENRDASHQGIMHRSLTTILTEERSRQRDWDYKISACLVEIYNDNCIDVLSGETGIQLYVDNGMETAYHKLKSVPITNEADADALIQVCTVKRKVARTALNPASSRSHLIILIRLQGCSKIHGESICSFLCLCDLAGFEDIIKAETQTNKILSKEAGYINRSLTAFNRVFVSLKKQDPNTVSYRDTKLTHLLKPFLTNSGKCALIVTVRNDKRSVGSTHNTLRFGKETRGVTLGKARRQVNIGASNQNNHY